MPNTFSKASNDQTLYTVNGEQITYKQFLKRYNRSENEAMGSVELEFTGNQHHIRVYGSTMYLFPPKTPPLVLFKHLELNPDVKVLEANKPSVLRKGFTLIELLVVLSIVAILTAASFSVYHRVSGGSNGSVIVTQFGETYYGRLISEDVNSVTIKSAFGRIVTITQPYTISR